MAQFQTGAELHVYYVRVGRSDLVAFVHYALCWVRNNSCTRVFAAFYCTDFCYVALRISDSCVGANERLLVLNCILMINASPLQNNLMYFK